MKYENIDLIDALRRISDIHTEHYKEDFELDQKLIRDLAATHSAEDKHLLWMSRPHGTHIMREREVYIEDTYENKIWEFYRDQTSDPILAYSVEITGVKDGTVVGNLIELDYTAHVDRMKQLTVDIEKVAVTFEDQNTYYLPLQSYRREAAAMKDEHGNVASVAYLPESERELQMILRRERFKTSFHAQPGNIEDHIRQLSEHNGVPFPEKKVETLAVMPVDAQNAYNEIKEAHPDAIVGFAQNGYFEVYGEDAKKAASILGTKLLVKELEGGGQVAVTGFREDEWAAYASKLWAKGSDVFLTRTGEDGAQETVKDLRGADYIPVGLEWCINDQIYKITDVNYEADTVTLVNLTDPTQPPIVQDNIKEFKEVSEMYGMPFDLDETAEMKKAFLAEKTHKAEKQPKQSVLKKLKEHAQNISDKEAKKPEQSKKPKSKEMEI